MSRIVFNWWELLWFKLKASVAPKFIHQNRNGNFCFVLAIFYNLRNFCWLEINFFLSSSYVFKNTGGGGSRRFWPGWRTNWFSYGNASLSQTPSTSSHSVVAFKDMKEYIKKKAGRVKLRGNRRWSRLKVAQPFHIQLWDDAKGERKEGEGQKEGWRQAQEEKILFQEEDGRQQEDRWKEEINEWVTLYTSGAEESTNK